jgi:DHA2 family multidrug resistance protein
MAHGMSAADAAKGAYAYLYARLAAQVHLLAFMDCFRVIGWITLFAAPVVLLTKRFAVGAKPTGGH